MGQINHEEIIRAAYVRSLVTPDTSADKAKETAGIARYRNMFKAAEASAYRTKTGLKGPVPIADLAKYITNKYPEHTVTEQGKVEIDEVPLVYTLADFKAEALACNNKYHLTNWAEKHKNRIKKHLDNEEEISELRSFVGGLLAEFRGILPVPEEPTSGMGAYNEQIPECAEQVVDDGPTDWQLAVEFDALCTEEQIKLLAGEVSKILRDSPFVVEGSCKMVTR